MLPFKSQKCILQMFLFKSQKCNLYSIFKLNHINFNNIIINWIRLLLIIFMILISCCIIHAFIPKIYYFIEDIEIKVFIAIIGIIVCEILLSYHKSDL